MNGAPRKSNIELLRIVAMLMVLAIHANFWRIGSPTHTEAVSAAVPTFTRIWMQSLALPCVDVFVIISGWFAIRPKWKSVLNLYFLLVFWAVCAEAASGEWRAWAIVFPQLGWFIPAYLALYLFAPVLNAFAEHAEKSAFLKYLAVFFVLQTFFDLVHRVWYIQGHPLFNDGYSAVSLMGLYMLGRYLRLHPPRWAERSAAFFASCYFGIFTASALVVFAALRFCSNAHWCSIVMVRTLAYTNPLTIAGSVALFYAFERMDFTNRLVNRMAASAFGVFCFHSMWFYAPVVRHIYNDFNGPAVLLLDGAFILAVYTVGTAIDQVRIFLWRLVAHD
ncbi:MAG: acyltransferase family protein [Kiritimatiellae bacterium]|nr:acyltransferase family protein [Kiritimatiellia bacterium]